MQTAGAERTDVDVAIVIPCLDEAETLPLCLENAREALLVLEDEHGMSGEVVVADNGSTDGSPGLAESFGARVVHIEGRGYGNALIGGISATRARYVAMGDADGSYDFREAVPMVLKLRDGYELCMGSRLHGRIRPGAMPWKNRYIGNPLLTGALNLLFHSGLSDAHCGLRACTKEAFERMRLTAMGMEFASEMLIKASLLGLKRTEVPVTLSPDKRRGPSHLRPWRDGWRHLRYLFMLSPAWLFLGPSAFLGTIGLAIFLTLILFSEAEVVRIGPVWFGNHWMVLSGALLAACHQTVVFGLATTLFGIREGYRRVTPFVRRLFRALRLEWMLLAGLVAIAIGGAILVDVLISWSARGFGTLDKVRELVAAATLALIGLQNIFGGFLLAIVGGNEAKLHLALERAAEGDALPAAQAERNPE